ncbi:MAG: oligosaccharide flippase family protein [Clostridiales bacterium]|nr:oligosaccharide flippase family protein [Clostridiales bacterium]
MSKSEKQSFLQGSLILIIGGVIVKIIGACFKLPLASMLGGTGMAFFNTAYNIFVPIQVIAVAGVPVALSRMVAESYARGQYRNIRRIHNVAFQLFLITGIVGTVAMFGISFIFVQFVKAPQAIYSMLVMSPAVFFSCMMSVNRGYYTGLSNMTPTAVSQIIEALSKLLLGLLFANLIIGIGMQEFAQSGTVFGSAVADEEAAQSACLPFAAAGAIAGVVVGSLLGSVYLFLRRRIKGDGITAEMLEASPPADSARTILKAMMVIAIPVALGSLADNLASLIDSMTVQRGVENAVAQDVETVRAVFGAYIPASTPVNEIHNFLYGSYSGYAITLFNLVPALTLSFGISALPAVTSSWAVGDKLGTKKNIETVLRVTSLLAIPGGLGLTVLAGPVLKLIFSGNPHEVGVATPLLTMLGIAVIFVSLAATVNSMLQAVGKAALVLKLLICSAVIKLIFNVILVNIPQINILGTPVGTIASYFFLMASGIFFLCRTTKVVPDFIRTFVRPLTAGLFCAAAAYAVNGLLGLVISQKIATIAAIAVAGVVYVVSLLLLRAIAREDVLMLPKGEKIVKALEKRGWIE